MPGVLLGIGDTVTLSVTSDNAVAANTLWVCEPASLGPPQRDPHRLSLRPGGPLPPGEAGQGGEPEAGTKGPDPSP
jgi:hypothetical protein